MNWYIGQEIVCVNDSMQAIAYVLKKGEVYVISEIFSVEDGGIAINVRGIEMGYTTSGLRRGHCETRFRPLDELANISELTEILQTTKPFDI